MPLMNGKCSEADFILFGMMTTMMMIMMIVMTMTMMMPMTMMVMLMTMLTVTMKKPLCRFLAGECLDMLTFVGHSTRGETLFP